MDEASVRNDALLVLQGLLDGSLSRVAAAKWAEPFIINDNLVFESNTVWRAIERIGAAELLDGGSGYLYGEEDFRAWMEEIAVK